jgi:hypothetical protein
MECTYLEYKYARPMRDAPAFRKVNIVECQGLHARAVGDGSASVDLLAEKEVDEDLEDDLLDGAVTDAIVSCRDTKTR